VFSFSFSRYIIPPKLPSSSSLANSPGQVIPRIEYATIDDGDYKPARLCIERTANGKRTALEDVAEIIDFAPELI